MSDTDPQAGLENVLTHVIQEFMQFMHTTGLSRHEIHALLYIYHGGEPQVSEIGDLTGASAAAASQLVDRLARQGLVERVEDPENRRARKLRLTPKSLKLIRQGIHSNRFMGELMDRLTPTQRRTVLTAFHYLQQAAEEMHSIHGRKAEQHAQTTQRTTH